MWKQCVRHQSTYNKSLASLYPSSSKLAQQVIPKDALFKQQPNVEFAPSYYDDFTKLDPYWDYVPGLPGRYRHMPSALPQWVPPDQKMPANYNIMKDSDKAQIPMDEMKRTGNAGAAGAGAKAAKDSTLFAKDIAKRTGVDEKYLLQNLKMKPLIVKPVKNTTAKGKIMSFYSLVVVGDGNGIVGLGEGKSRSEVSKAVQQAHRDAIRNLVKIPLYENRTIFSDLDYKFHGVQLHFRTKKPGFGLSVNHVIYEIANLAGIKDLSAKVYKSRNQMNIAKGTIEALTRGQKTLEEIALQRGKKVVDVKKIYYE